MPLVDGERFRSQLHLGAFKTEREARSRARWARDEWAAGRIPDPKRIVTTTFAARRVTIASVARDWLESRVDLAPSSRMQYRSRVERITDDLGSMSVEEVTPAVVRAWVSELAAEFAPSTTGIYLHVLRLALDHAGQEPNAARHRSVKLPKGRMTNVRIRLPASRDLALIRAELPERHRRLLDFLEDTGVRIQEACLLDWADVEHDRILIRGSKRAASMRWVDRRLHPIRLLTEPPGEGRVFGLTDGGFTGRLGGGVPARRHGPLLAPRPAPSARQPSGARQGEPSGRRREAWPRQRGDHARRLHARHRSRLTPIGGSSRSTRSTSARRTTTRRMPQLTRGTRRSRLRTVEGGSPVSACTCSLVIRSGRPRRTVASGGRRVVAAGARVSVSQRCWHPRSPIQASRPLYSLNCR